MIIPREVSLVFRKKTTRNYNGNDNENHGDCDHNDDNNNDYVGVIIKTMTITLTIFSISPLVLYSGSCEENLKTA